jgi:hypothetical protein
MKTYILIAALVVLAVVVGRGQAATAGGITINTVTALTQCAQPTSGSSLTLICPMPTGLYVSSNGSAYAPIGSGLPSNCPQATIGPVGLTFGSNCK